MISADPASQSEYLLRIQCCGASISCGSSGTERVSPAVSVSWSGFFLQIRRHGTDMSCRFGLSKRISPANGSFLGKKKRAPTAIGRCGSDICRYSGMKEKPLLRGVCSEICKGLFGVPKKPAGIWIPCPVSLSLFQENFVFPTIQSKFSDNFIYFILYIRQILKITIYVHLAILF